LASILLLLAIVLHHLALLAAGFVLGGLMFGFSIVSHSSVINSFFGMRHYPLNFSVLTLYSLLSAFGPYVAGVFHTWLGWYVALPLMILVLAAISLVLALVLKKP
jgi:OFA family oxalate/formate antiporter-like MFS transporter